MKFGPRLKPWGRTAIRHGREIKKQIRRVRILQEMRVGSTYGSIARKLRMSESTVKLEMGRIMEKHIATTTEAERKAMTGIPTYEMYPTKTEKVDHELRQRAMLLRQEGHTYENISSELGIHEDTARKYVLHSLEKLGEDETREAELVRRLHLGRLDRLLTATFQRATGEDMPNGMPDYEAVGLVLKILKRQADLLGLDAPARVNIEQRIRLIAQEAGLDEEAFLKEAQVTIKTRTVESVY